MKSKLKKIVSVSLVFALMITTLFMVSVTKTDAATRVWGVDVSHHQGVVDWAKMKQAGVQFAIIRLGYGTRYNGTITVDSQFDANVRNARAQGIDIGVYLYSYALTVDAAKREAQGVIDVLNRYPRHFTYPIWYDFEDPDQMKVERASLNAQEIKTFCDMLENAGYYAGVYGSRGFFGKNSYIDDTQLGAYDHWIADYGPNNGYDSHGCKYPGSYGMWQYTSKGLHAVPAGTVSSSGLDLDYAYKNYPQIIRNAGLNGFGGGTAAPSADQKAAAQNLATFIEAYEARIPRVQLQKNRNLPIFRQYKSYVEEARRYVNLDWKGGTSASYPSAARMWELCAENANGGLLESTYMSLRDVVGLDRQGFRKVTQKALDDWTASGLYTSASLQAAAQVRYDADVRDVGYNNTDVITENVINDMRAVLRS